MSNTNAYACFLLTTIVCFVNCLNAEDVYKLVQYSFVVSIWDWMGGNLIEKMKILQVVGVLFPNKSSNVSFVRCRWQPLYQLIGSNSSRDSRRWSRHTRVCQRRRALYCNLQCIQREEKSTALQCFQIPPGRRWKLMSLELSHRGLARCLYFNFLLQPGKAFEGWKGIFRGKWKLMRGREKSGGITDLNRWTDFEGSAHFALTGTFHFFYFQEKHLFIRVDVFWGGSSVDFGSKKSSLRSC